MMIDDLDLEFEDDEQKGKHRRRKKRKRERGGFRTWLALFVTLALFGGLGYGVYVGFQKITSAFTTPDYEGTGIEETAQVEIITGANLTDIAKVLTAAGITKSDKAFIEASNANPEALKIQPGFYTLRKQMSGEAAVLALLDPVNRIVNGLLVREGLITLEIYALLAEKLGLKIEDIRKAAEDPVKLGIPDWWFKRNDGVTGPKSLEGFLFPATYEFPPNVTAEGALKVMVNKFLSVAGNMKFADRVQAERHISPYEALVAASIVEAEVNKPDDMGKTARAIYNRAYTDKSDTRLLQVDAAINYWLKLQGKDPKHSNDLRQSELNNPNNPYNTHVRPGMPITPIGNPGENALKAAMDPPLGNWLFWVTVDAQGTTLFAENIGGHESNIRIGCRNGFLTNSIC